MTPGRRGFSGSSLAAVRALLNDPRTDSDTTTASNPAVRKV